MHPHQRRTQQLLIASAAVTVAAVPLTAISILMRRTVTTAGREAHTERWGVVCMRCLDPDALRFRSLTVLATVGVTASLHTLCRPSTTSAREVASRENPAAAVVNTYPPPSSSPTKSPSVTPPVAGRVCKRLAHAGAAALGAAVMHLGRLASVMVLIDPRNKTIRVNNETRNATPSGVTRFLNRMLVASREHLKPKMSVNEMSDYGRERLAAKMRKGRWTLLGLHLWRNTSIGPGLVCSVVAPIVTHPILARAVARKLVGPSGSNGSPADLTESRRRVERLRFQIQLGLAILSTGAVFNLMRVVEKNAVIATHYSAKDTAFQAVDSVVVSGDIPGTYAEVRQLLKPHRFALAVEAIGGLVGSTIFDSLPVIAGILLCEADVF